MKIYRNIFDQIISPENLFLAWDEFRKGKSTKSDVLDYKSNLESNIFHLSDELKMNKYAPGAYTSFYINDPKQRRIHKASVGEFYTMPYLLPLNSFLSRLLLPIPFLVVKERERIRG